MNATIACPENASVEPKRDHPAMNDVEESWDLWVEEVCSNLAAFVSVKSPRLIAVPFEKQLRSVVLDD